MTGGEQDRHRLPGAGGVHGFHERGSLAEDEGLRVARGLKDRVALEPVKAAEVLFRGDRGLPVAFQPDADDGNAWTGHTYSLGWFAAAQAAPCGAIRLWSGRRHLARRA